MTLNLESLESRIGVVVGVGQGARSIPPVFRGDSWEEEGAVGWFRIFLPLDSDGDGMDGIS